MIDSTVGYSGDTSQMDITGETGSTEDFKTTRIPKTFNLYNIRYALNNKNVQLLFGNRDLNKIKCAILCKIKNDKNDPSIDNFNNGDISISYNVYKNFLKIKEYKWLANMNNWLPFWNPTSLNATKDNYKIWHSEYDISTSDTPFLDRFNKIFGPDTTVGTMSAGNLLYTIPFEVLTIPEEQKEDKDYLAFIVLSVFNAGFNKKDKGRIINYKKIEPGTNLHDTYINGLFYKFFTKIGKGTHINFIGYVKNDNKTELYLLSHGGITNDLITKHENIITELKDLITQNKKQITNTEDKQQSGGAINVDSVFDSEEIIKAVTSYNEQLCDLVKECMIKLYDCMETQLKQNINKIENVIPTDEMLLILALGAPYKPNPHELRFVMYSPINPGIAEILTKNKGFVCSDKTMIQILGHVPKGFGPTLFTFGNAGKKSHIVNIDISQSFKYNGLAGTTDVKLVYKLNSLQMDYTLDIRQLRKNDKKDLTTLNFQSPGDNDSKNYCHINISDNELKDKIFKVNNSITILCEQEEEIKGLLENETKIPKGYKILYHGCTAENIHIFSISDKYDSPNKILVLYKYGEESQAGGYYAKYMKYKQKYLQLKNTSMF